MEWGSIRISKKGGKTKLKAKFFLRDYRFPIQEKNESIKNGMENILLFFKNKFRVNGRIRKDNNFHEVVFFGDSKDVVELAAALTERMGEIDIKKIYEKGDKDGK